MKRGTGQQLFTPDFDLTWPHRTAGGPRRGLGRVFFHTAVSSSHKCIHSARQHQCSHTNDVIKWHDVIRSDARLLVARASFGTRSRPSGAAQDTLTYVVNTMFYTRDGKGRRGMIDTNKNYIGVISKQSAMYIKWILQNVMAQCAICCYPRRCCYFVTLKHTNLLFYRIYRIYYIIESQSAWVGKTNQSLQNTEL